MRLLPARSARFVRLRGIAPRDGRRDLRDGLSALRRYLGVSAVGHLLWEILQLPLYTIWAEGTPGEIVFAVTHCTAGDLLIALASLAGALVLGDATRWPAERFREVAIATVLLGLAYTVYSEWLNVSVRGSWAYAPSMPTIPPLGTGLSPTLQWIAVPLAALRAVRRVSGTATSTRSGG